MTPEPESAAQAGNLVGRHRIGDVMKLLVRRTEARLSAAYEGIATNCRHPVQHYPSHEHLYLGDAFLAANIISWAITSVFDLPAVITQPTLDMFGFPLSLLCHDGGWSTPVAEQPAGCSGLRYARRRNHGATIQRHAVTDHS
ncbi:uncharacterized protein LOC144119099 [Amblyomma americanum]